MIKNIREEILKIKDELVELSEYIYENPETAFEEYKACKAHMDILNEYGFQLEEKFLGFDTAFKAVYDSGKEGPTISYLAEYDALPGIGHGCGHNLLGTISTGAGIILSKFIDEVGGRVIVLGTPAEEVAGVKVDMVNQGVFDDIDVSMLVHPNASYLQSGFSLALDQMKIIFKGKSAHASSFPHEGVNALDACISTFNNINAMREHILEDSRIHGIIREGGTAVNVIPERVVAEFAVRSPNTEYRNTLKEKLINCAKAGALATGCQLEIIESTHPYDAMITNENLSNLYSKNLKIAGVKDLGPKRAGGGSVDMGNVSEVCPAIHPYIGIIEPDREQYATHTKEFAEETITDYAYDNMVMVIEALVKTALDIIKDEEILKSIKDEFNERQGV